MEQAESKQQTMIQKIVNARKATAEKVTSLSKEWEARKSKLEKLKKVVDELDRICKRLAGTRVDTEKFVPLSEVIAAIAADGIFSTLKNDVAGASKTLERLKLRFTRNSVNLAAVGVGRCGKSTALKTLIGYGTTDNDVIPSGAGPAVTAGRSEIHSISKDNEEYAEVDFYSEESFLNVMVNAPIEAMGLGTLWNCKSLDDFADMDLEQVARDLAERKKDANRKLQELRTAGKEKDNPDYVLAQRSADDFTAHEERLRTLRMVRSSFPHFRNRLTGKTEKIGIREVGRHVSYQDENLTANICFAVKGCRIYAHFPNNEAQGLVLVDLPGLGTMSDMERRCFLEGMNYSVDAALIIRRPEGLFQNYPAQEDDSVKKFLAGIYGNERIPQFTVLFQNDANLPMDGANRAFDALKNKVDAGMLVLRGDASSQGYMTDELLPAVLNFVEENVPKLDKVLMEEASKPLENAAQEFDALYNTTIEKLRRLRHLFPASGGVGEILTLADSVKNSWTRDLVALLNGLSDSSGNVEQIASLSYAITAAVEEARRAIHEEFSAEAEGKLEDLSLRTMQDHSVIPYVNERLHAMRIRLSEVFSHLQSVHDEQIASMRKATGVILFKPLGTLSPIDPSLEAFCGILKKSGEAPQMEEAVENLLGVSIPFYTIMYPDLRREVFSQFERNQDMFSAIDKMPENDRAKPTLRMLQELGIQWVALIENLLRRQNRVREILAAAVERFTDRIVRNSDTRRELVAFLEQNLAIVNPSGNESGTVVRALLDRMTA